MPYVIYIAQKDPNDSTHILATYKTKRGLQPALEKFQTRYKDLPVRMTTRDDFEKNVVKMVKRRNLLNREHEFEISSVHADTFMDPSTETYHSM